MKDILSIQRLILPWLLVISCGLVSKDAIQSSPNLEKGVPLIENYSQQDYWGSGKIAQPQNWQIAQDLNNVMYFANNGTTLQFDGQSWRSLSQEVQTTRSIAIDENGRIFTGGFNEFGYYAPDSVGRLVYHPLSGQLDSSLANFRYIWAVICLPGKIFFLSSNYLFEWNYQQIKVHYPESAFHFAFNVRNELYVTDLQAGLKKLANDSLSLIAAGEMFRGNRIYAVLPFDAQSNLIVSRNNGLYIHNGITADAFAASALNKYLVDNQVSGACRLAEGKYAFSTLSGGIIVMDPHGEIAQVITKSTGLKADNVKNIFQDSEQGLWAAFSTGISRIELSGPITLINERSGLEGIPQSIVRFQGRLFAGTTQGIFRYYDAGFSENSWQKLRENTGPCWQLVSTGDELLAATASGVYQIQESRALRIYPVPSFNLIHSQIDPKRLYVASVVEFTSFYRVGGKWQKEDFQVSGAFTGRTAVETSLGDIWIGAPNQGLIKIGLSANDGGLNFRDPSINTFKQNAGLSGSEFNVFKTGDVIRLATSKKLYRVFDKGSLRLEADSSFGKAFVNGERDIFRLASDPKGNIWIHANNETILAELQNEGEYRIFDKHLLRVPEAQINTILAEGDGITWLGGRDGIIRYDIRQQRELAPTPSVLIRRISSLGDSTIYYGNPDRDLNLPFLELPEAESMIRFEYTLPSYDNFPANQYRVMLHGFDNQWSEWSTEFYKEYSRLPHGDYRFQVQAKNVYEMQAVDAFYNFSISPAWYNTTWGFIINSLVILSMFARIVLFFARQSYNKKEVETAKIFQQVLLPQEMLNITAYDINGECQTAFDVGGDHYDFFWLDKNETELIIWVVDVEGKRMTGAMYSVLVNGMIKMAFKSNPGQALPFIYKNINHSLLDLHRGNSISLLLGKLDITTHRFSYCNAGCPSPLLKSNGEIRPIQTSNGGHRPALGKIPGIPYTLHKCKLAENEVLFLYSDGLTDIKKFARKKHINPIRKILTDLNIRQTASQMSVEVFRQLQQLKGLNKQQDDQTLIIIKRISEKAAEKQKN